MTKNGSGQVARAEAQPFAWDRLTPAQRIAAEHAGTLLGDIASRPWEPRGDDRKRAYDFLPPIDDHRPNHVLLIDGGRGSGKTALFVTLLELWSRGVRGEGLPDPKEEKAKWERLVRQTAQVVPVGMVDLQPLPPSTNLMIHLVGQLQRAVEALEVGDERPRSDEREPSRAAWEMVGLDEPPPRKKWRKFLQAAALGWNDKGLDARRGQLDPEAFAVELEATERYLIDLRSTFRGLIDALAKSFRERGLSKSLRDRHDAYPLFVIPIDDADMNLEHTLNLLDLLRALWHPRVVFLITGDSRLFKARLRGQVRSQITPTPALEKDKTTEEERFSLEENLIDQAYRKIIPPNHRLLLPPLPPSARLRKMQSALERVDAPAHPLKLSNMAAYFDLMPFAAAILPGNLREIIDLEQWVTRHNGDESSVGGLKATELVWALTEHPLDYAEKYAEIDDPEWQLTQVLEQKLASALEHTHWGLMGPRKTFAPVKLGRPLISMAGSSRLRLLVDDAFSDDDGAAEEIHGGTAKEIALLDACWESSGDRWRRTLPPLPFLIQSRSAAKNFDWPVPQWKSLIDLMALYHSLDELFGIDIPGQGTNASDVARQYVAVILEYAALREKRSEDAERRPPLRDDIVALVSRVRSRSKDWPELAQGVAAMVTKPAPDSVVRAWALRGAGLLAAPEFGLNKTEANAWLKALKGAFAKHWAEARQNLQMVWARLFPHAEVTPGKKDSQRSAEWRQSFDWVSEVENSDRREFLLNELAGVLSGRKVPNVAQGAPPNFWSVYVSGAHREGLFRELSPAIVEAWTSSVGSIYNDENGMQSAVIDLWHRVKESGAAPDLPEPPANLDVPSMVNIYKTIATGPHPWAFSPEGTRYVIENGLRLSRGRFAWSADSTLSSSLARKLFEIAWDLAVDSAGLSVLARSDGVDDPRLRWWFGVGGSAGVGISLFPWPAVDWWSFLDHLLFEQAWNQRCGWVTSTAEKLRGGGKLGDDLAFWYVKMIDQILTNRTIDDTHLWWNAPSSENWRSMVGTMRHRTRGQVRGRWSCYKEWFERLPLLAAPESGLSSTAAGMILAAFAAEEVEPARLREARRLRLMNGLEMSQELVEQAVSQIDKETLDHPWVKQIEIE